MRSQSKRNRIAERYERIGSENPTVGMASSWKRITSFRNSVNKKGRTLTIGSPFRVKYLKREIVTRNTARYDTFKMIPSSIL